MAKKSSQSSSSHVCPPSAMPHHGRKQAATGVPAWKRRKQTQGK